MFSGAREWVYPLKVKGHFQHVHRSVGLALQAFLFITPWITVAGHPALRIDIAARRVYAFGATYTATDTLLLLFLLLLAAFSLFFFTSLYGRLWCGYACPQTVFLEEWIRRIETWIEGDRGKRMHRDRTQAWSWPWIWRKAVKYVSFAIVAVVISMAFMSFFAGARTLWTGGATQTQYGIVAFFSTLWFFDFAWFREQLCNYLCPYARFQSVLCDDESLVVAYDTDRGEPRGGKAARERGGCIDCKKCVAVCPQGIDIRDGFQLECITCARCIDACTGVMTKLGRPSLVSYSTIAAETGRRTRFFRPRTVAYAGILCALLTGLVWTLTTHHTIEAHVNRAPGMLFTVDPDGYIRNTYLLHLVNNDIDPEPELFTIEIHGLDPVDVTVPEVVLGPTEHRTVPLVVRIPPNADLPRTIPIRVHVETSTDARDLNATFKTSSQLALYAHGAR